MADEEEPDCCPLCMEELDITDKTFNACPCGYQVCLWCWHQIKNEYNGLCPACRAPYSELSKHKNTLDREDVVRRTKQRKQKEKTERRTASQSKHPTINRKNLANVRVMQRNLVYVIGLPVHFADEEILRSNDCFGQYGKIIKAVVNKSHLNSDRANATASAYITFSNKEDALACIIAIDGYYLDGSLLRASFGTTKYCNFFLRNLVCNNPDCLYLHELGDQDDSFTKEEMQSALHSGKAAFRDGSMSGGHSEVRAGSHFPPSNRPKPADSANASSSIQDASAASVGQVENNGSDAQRKAQSAAAIYKLKQAAHQSDSNSSASSSPGSTNGTSSSVYAQKKCDEPYSKIVAGGSSHSSNSHSASSTPPLSTSNDARKPNLTVDTSLQTNTQDAAETVVGPLEALKLATGSSIQEPAWAQPFPSPSVLATEQEDADAPSSSVFSPFGLGFEGGIHRTSPRPDHVWGSGPSAGTNDRNEHDLNNSSSVFPPPLPPAPRTLSSDGSRPSLSFASIDAIFSQRNESSEALAGLLGVQLTSTPLAHGNTTSQSKSAQNSRFAFANQSADSASSAPPLRRSSSSGMPSSSYGLGDSPGVPQRSSPFGYDSGAMGLGMSGPSSFPSRHDTSPFPPLGATHHHPNHISPTPSPFGGEFGSSGLSMAGATNNGSEPHVSGLAFLQQMLPNVNISFGGEFPSPSNAAPRNGSSTRMNGGNGLFARSNSLDSHTTDAWNGGGLMSLGFDTRSSTNSGTGSFYDPAIVSQGPGNGHAPNGFYAFGSAASKPSGGENDHNHLHSGFGTSSYLHPNSLVNNGTN